MHQYAKDLHFEEEKKIKLRNFCEVIHIGVVCSGYSSNVFFHNLLKSLFFHRLNPIHFHLLVSNESELVLRHLFKTWQINNINVTFYNINNWLKDVRWVPNMHYSGNYGLLKLIFNKIIPPKLTAKLIILDTDLIINDDIYLLWKLFDNFTYKQVIGIGENLSPHYLGQLTQSRPWPALGTGFNSGVMLQDLNKLNSIKWTDLWVDLTKRYTTIYGQTSLGDQDIINSVIKENPYIFYKLPCYWNLQMSTHATSNNCYNKYQPKIIHWNSPQKYSIVTVDGKRFRGLLRLTLEMNGLWLRNYPQLCRQKNEILENATTKAEEDNNNNDKNTCDKFRKPSNMKYRTLLYFAEFKFTSDDSDITYCTHLSFDRRHLMERIAKIWTGPISFTLYLSDAELMDVIQLVQDSEILNRRTDIAYHAVFKQGELYPTNVLRNTGLKFVKTPYSFLVDVDFIPMKSLFEILKDTIRSMNNLDKKALVVPAFESTSEFFKTPTSKIQLIESLDKNEIRPFLMKKWAPGHAPTDYERWRKEYEPYKVKWQMHYEPYIVVKSNIIPYDERFLGFGWNKVTHTMELEAQKYEFIVLSDVFIVHDYHSISSDNNKFKHSLIYNRCIQLIKNEFIQELSSKYHRNFSDFSNIEDNRFKRSVQLSESTTSLYDSTDYFLLWGGKEKFQGKKQLRKSLKENSAKALKENDYYYYDSNPPYNLTIIKLNNDKIKEYPSSHSIKKEKESVSTEEDHNYEYDEEDIKFKDLHDSTTILNPSESITILSDKDLIPYEENLRRRSAVNVDESKKNM